ncbi:DnaA/Hda family protein [Aestuariivita sp.]|jgi:chromosomal replication initiation ATPase DnaA|uniref:HdaA/DnaA family protein n=1 Tax=Aestuariivita sp. TaxID=1872407 RepID=UPI00216FCFA9|nr:DnaA/Hda family protein [Aestuariivita sp.]MCE8006220.1 chromosomal replication initiator DnaA [Aestuariivita sp.]
MPEQLSFDLPGKAALGREDFFVAPSNALAVAMVENSARWSSGKLILSGPEGAGKTHLAHVWAAQTNARIVPATALAEADIAELAEGPVCVEDIPALAGQHGPQEALFHLHNLILANGHTLLLTGQGTPRHWGLTLPDLQSRMEGTQSVTLEPPDDLLLSALLAKLFADRQIAPKPDLIPYLVKRMERSFAAAQSVVDRLDHASLSKGRPLTRRLAADVLGPADKTA